MAAVRQRCRARPSTPAWGSSAFPRAHCRATTTTTTSDLLRSLIEASAEASSTSIPTGRARYIPPGDRRSSCARSSFLIADGVLPSDGRARLCAAPDHAAGPCGTARMSSAATDPLMWRLVPALVGEMGQAYPELGRAQAMIEETLRSEETRFRQTLDRGLHLLDEELGRLSEGAAFPGEAAFKLYDTFGFPLDLTQDALRERGRTVD